LNSFLFALQQTFQGEKDKTKIIADLANAMIKGFIDLIFQSLPFYFHNQHPG